MGEIQCHNGLTFNFDTDGNFKYYGSANCTISKWYFSSNYFDKIQHLVLTEV